MFPDLVNHCTFVYKLTMVEIHGSWEEQKSEERVKLLESQCRDQDR